MSRSNRDTVLDRPDRRGRHDCRMPHPCYTHLSLCIPKHYTIELLRDYIHTVPSIRDRHFCTAASWKKRKKNKLINFEFGLIISEIFKNDMYSTIFWTKMHTTLQLLYVNSTISLEMILSAQFIHKCLLIHNIGMLVLLLIRCRNPKYENGLFILLASGNEH